MSLNSSSGSDLPQLKGFVIDKKLGSGTYASVYKARLKVCFIIVNNLVPSVLILTFKNTNDTFAIKCIKKSGLNKSSTENLLSEIKILKQIKHDYIVQLVDFQVYNIFIA